MEWPGQGDLLGTVRQAHGGRGGDGAELVQGLGGRVVRGPGVHTEGPGRGGGQRRCRNGPAVCRGRHQGARGRG